jgi:hypothetical protein
LGYTIACIACYCSAFLWHFDIITEALHKITDQDALDDIVRNVSDIQANRAMILEIIEKKQTGGNAHG